MGTPAKTKTVPPELYHQPASTFTRKRAASAASSSKPRVPAHHGTSETTTKDVEFLTVPDATTTSDSAVCESSDPGLGTQERIPKSNPSANGTVRPRQRGATISSARHFSAGAVFPASPLRERVSPFSSATSSRRVSQSTRANYPLILTPALSLHPPSEVGNEDILVGQSGTTSVSSLSSYPHSIISYSSRDSQHSYGSYGLSEGTATPLGTILSSVSDDDPYLTQIMDLTTQQYRENLHGETPSNTLHPPPMSGASSRRSTRASAHPPEKTASLQGPLAPVSEAIPNEATPNNATCEPEPARDFKASKETLYRSNRCKQYFETRYAHVHRLQTAKGLRYNPLEVIRWRRSMWQRAVKSGADEQKKWKLRYYMWHVGNSELSEFYNEKTTMREEQKTRSSLEESAGDSSESADDFMGNMGKVLGSRWMRGLKRRQQGTDDEKELSTKMDRFPSTKEDHVTQWTTSLMDRDGGETTEDPNIGSPSSTDLNAFDEAQKCAPSLLLQFLDGSTLIQQEDEAMRTSAQSVSHVPPFEKQAEQSISDETAVDHRKPSIETSVSSLSGMRQESDVESVGDLTCNSSSSAPGHGRKKSGFWDRLREKRGELGVSDSKNSATALARKKSLAGTVDQLTSRMRRSSASGKTLERAGSMDAARTLGGRGMTDPTFAQRARTPSPLKQIAHHPADAVDEGLLISPRRVELSDLSDGSVEGAPSRPEETGLGIFNVKVAQVAPEFMPEHLINDVQTAQSTRLAGQGSGSSRRGSQRNHESYIPQGTQLPLNRGKEEALASDSDDGESRIRGRRLKSMMGKIGRRREKGRNGSDAVSPDSHHESDMEGGAIPDDHSGAVKSRNVRDQDRGSPAPRGKKWVWDSSSSDEETRSVFDQNQSDKARGRKVGKGLSREGDTQSNGDLTEASETFKTSSRRKRAVRKFIGDRLKSASSASLVREPMDIDLQSNEGRRDSTRPGRPSNVGTDLTTSVTSADEEGDREDPGSPYSNDGARCDSVTRDPNSPFTAEEQHFYDDLMALAQRLDVLMPAAEDLKASFTHQIASRDAAIVGFEARLKPPYNRRSVQNQVLGSTDMTNEPLSMLDTSGSSIAVESLAEGQGFHRMSFSRARETGLETMLDVVKASLASLEQKCQDIEERNARSHQEVSTMVCNLDAVTQEVNEDLSRQLKMVEEAIQQIEGTPNALGSMQEWYYQLIAYVLGILGFTIWLWFQLWKVGRKAIGGARMAVAIVSPKAVSAVDGFGQAAGKAVKDRTLQSIASVTGLGPNAT